MRIKDLRNSIVHFNSTHTTLKYEGVEIQGLADTSDYDALSFEMARNALFASEEIIAEVLALAGVEREKVKYMLHSWTGRPPV